MKSTAKKVTKVKKLTKEDLKRAGFVKATRPGVKGKFGRDDKPPEVHSGITYHNPPKNFRQKERRRRKVKR